MLVIFSSQRKPTLGVLFVHWRRQNDNWGGGGGRIFIYVRSA